MKYIIVDCSSEITMEQPEFKYIPIDPDMVITGSNKKIIIKYKGKEVYRRSSVEEIDLFVMRVIGAVNDFLEGDGIEKNVFHISCALGQAKIYAEQQKRREAENTANP